MVIIKLENIGTCILYESYLNLYYLNIDLNINILHYLNLIAFQSNNKEEKLTNFTLVH